MAVIAAFELDDLATAGETARQSNGAHGGFGAGADQAYLFHAGHQSGYQFRHFQFQCRRGAERQTVGSGSLYRGNDFWMCVPKYHWTPGADIVDIFLVILVPQA
jgi:hypothetical protein